MWGGDLARLRMYVQGTVSPCKVVVTFHPVGLPLQHDRVEIGARHRKSNLVVGRRERVLVLTMTFVQPF